MHYLHHRRGSTCDSVFKCTSCNHKSYVSTITRDRGLAFLASPLTKWWLRPNDSYDPMECCFHGGTDKCEIPQRNKPMSYSYSDKIIEVRSNGRKVRSNGMKVRSKGMEVRSNGMEVRSNGRKVRSNGTRIRSNGMQVAIRLHFCPECPSITSW